MLSCIVSDGFGVVVVGGGIMVEEILLTYLELMILFWEETSLRRDPSHVMVTLKGVFKVDMGEKFLMMPLVGIINSGIDISKWGEDD